MSCPFELKVSENCMQNAFVDTGVVYICLFNSMTILWRVPITGNAYLTGKGFEMSRFPRNLSCTCARIVAWW